MILTGELIYILCALTAIACTALLARAYRRTGIRILLWSMLCFALLAINNVLLFLDLVIFTRVDLSFFRDISGFLAFAVLVCGLIWDAE